MDNKVLAICDADKRFALKLMEVFCSRKNLGFIVHAFSDLEEFKQFAQENQLEILLITGRLMREEFQNYNIGKIVLLSDGEIYEEFLDYETIYKYQSAQKILKEILYYYAEYARFGTGMFSGNKEFKVYSVYSPIGRCGKSALAKVLAQKFGKSKKTLLLDLQSFAAYEEQLGDEELWDLADIIYFLRQGKKTFLYKLGSIVLSKDQYDYVLPMKTPADLRSVTLAEWTELMEKLATDSEYQVIILDFGHEVSGLFGLLSQCTKIYTPVLSDEDSKRKIRNFEKVLKDENFERVLESTEKVPIPIGISSANLKTFLYEWAERHVES